jgi:hypothetical protein
MINKKTFFSIKCIAAVITVAALAAASGCSRSKPAAVEPAQTDGSVTLTAEQLADITKAAAEKAVAEALAAETITKNAVEEAARLEEEAAEETVLLETDAAARAEEAEPAAAQEPAAETAAPEPPKPAAPVYALGDAGPGGGVVYYAKNGTYKEVYPKLWTSDDRYMTFHADKTRDTYNVYNGVKWTEGDTIAELREISKGLAASGKNPFKEEPFWVFTIEEFPVSRGEDLWNGLFPGYRAFMAYGEGIPEITWAIRLSDGKEARKVLVNNPDWHISNQDVWMIKYYLEFDDQRIEIDPAKDEYFVMYRTFATP